MPAKIVYCRIVAALLIVLTVAQCFGQGNPYRLKGKNAVQSKNYYLLTLFQEDLKVKQLLSNDPQLLELSRKKIADLKRALKDCKDFSCFTTKMKFSAEEIKLVGDRLAELDKPGSDLEHLVKTQLIPSHTYSLYQDLSPAQQLQRAWQQDAEGINHTIAVYGEGKAPNYPQIDSIAFNVKDKAYGELIYDATATILDQAKDSHLFFEPSLASALLFLDINNRNNTADDEPMEKTVNKAAVERVKIIDWKKYAYTLIMVPGAGPDDDLTELSAEGILRCRVAAHRYFEGMAPFIMVSGGKVHPYKTKYCEAVEMKRYLLNSLHVPEKAIILEPHARHTTTNMRNCARLIFRYGLPVDKPFITSTNKSQSFYITAMDKRCLNELHYVPYKLGKRLSDTGQEFYPLVQSLQINADEPLDP